MRIGYFLGCEVWAPRDLLHQARLAEEAGFEGLWISDHFHPWSREQGQSPFMWSVIGGLSQATSLPVTSAVVCPTMRVHPAIVAQAAATSSVMLDGRFVLGVGSGEALNELILGNRWPGAGIRLEMLEEAIEVIRELQEGRTVTHRGRHFTVEHAKIWTRPKRPTPIYVSALGPKSIRLAGRVGDGYICIQPNAEFVRTFRESGGGDRPVQGGLKVCWAPTEQAGVETAYRLWRSEQLPGELDQILATPEHVDQASTLVTRQMVAEAWPCGPDRDKHVQALLNYAAAGFDELYVQQIGEQQEEFFDFYAREVLPEVRRRAPAQPAPAGASPGG